MVNVERNTYEGDDDKCDEDPCCKTHEDGTYIVTASIDSQEWTSARIQFKYHTNNRGSGCGIDYSLNNGPWTVLDTLVVNDQLMTYNELAPEIIGVSSVRIRLITLTGGDM